MKTRAGFVPLLFLLCSGCLDALVGEECAEGYTLCGDQCLPVAVCYPPDAGPADGALDGAVIDAPADAGEAGPEDAPSADREGPGDAPADAMAEVGEDVPVEAMPRDTGPVDTESPDVPVVSPDTQVILPPDTAIDSPVPQPDSLPPDTPRLVVDTAPDLSPDAVEVGLEAGSEVADASDDGVAEGGVALADAWEAGLDTEADAPVDAAPDQAPDAPGSVLDAPRDQAPDLVDAFWCPLGQTACGETCVNTATDPDNCGTCGLPCANGLCSNGHCESQGTGRLIVIGHDYYDPRPAMNRVLGNAVFLWPTNPVRLLVYEGKGNVTAIAGAEAAIAQVAAATGRQYSKTIATGSGVPVALANADVFLVHAQEAATNAELSALGTEWSSALTTFVTNGGTLVVLDAVHAANDGTTQLLAAPGLFTVTARTDITGDVCTVIALGDAVSTGLFRTYRCEPHSVGFATTEANQVVTASGDVAVVIHKVF